MEETNALKATLVALVRGQWSDKGNYSGYTSKGARVHIPKLMMGELGFEKDAVDKDGKPVKVPQLFACVVERTFDVLNDDGESTGDTFTRAQAGSVFLTKQEAIDAMNSDDLLALEAKADLYKGAKSFGLTEENLAKMSVALF